MGSEYSILILFFLLVVFLSMGAPVAFALAGVSVAVGYFLWRPDAATLVAFNAIGLMERQDLLAVPLFLIMANVLQHSGVADDMYEAIRRWFSGVSGGLAIGTIVIATIFAAMSGTSAAGCVTMGLIALPAMLSRGYDKRLAIGSIMAGGALGPLIPPSIILIMYGVFAEQSVGQLFAGGLFPGLMLAFMFMVYIYVVCARNPALGPPLPPQARASWVGKLRSLRSVILPVFLVLGVLGSIFSGVATPTEAASVGAFGSLVCAAIYRRLNFRLIKVASIDSIKITGMIMFILIGGKVFASVCTALRAPEVVGNILLMLPGGRWGSIIAMQFSYLILGCLMDAGAIMMITIPLYVPIVCALGFDPVWFGVVFMVNMELAFLTPPFGFNLFYMKGIVPKGITMGDIYRSIIPFVLIQLTGLIIVLVFPQIIMWLPNQLFV